MKARQPVKKNISKKPHQPKPVKSSLAGINSYYILGGILLITLLLFYNTLTNNFVTLDDTGYIRDNPDIKSLSANNIAAIFSSFYNANYHPFTTLSYAIEYSLFGLNARPYHVVNLILHVLNVFMVFRLIRKIYGRLEVALIVSLFFAIHPMHVESVAWISERKDLLYSFFFICGLSTYCEYIHATTNKNKIYIYTILLFLCSLLSKSTAIIFPLMLLIFDYYFQRGWKKKVLYEKIPFFLLSLVFGVITIFSQKSFGAINADLMPDYNLVQRFFVVCFTTSYYIVRLVLPFKLAVLHFAPTELPYYYYLSPLFLLLLAFLVYKAKAMKREMIFGFLFYLVGTSLTSQIIPVGYVVVSERYSYIPYIGLFFIIGCFYAAVQDKRSFASLKPIINYLLGGIALFFIVITFQRNMVWENSINLFTDLVKKYPNQAHAHFILGKNLIDVPDANGALTSINKAIELDPKMSESYFYRGNIYYGQQNYPAALNDYLKAVELNPKYSEAYYNIGVTYSTTNQFQESIEPLTKAISIMPNEYMYQARGSSFFNLRRLQEAADDYAKAIAINPKNGQAYFNRGATYLNMQQTAKACADWKTASGLGFAKADEMIKAYCK
jgi:tetratricopeptide (TPR) repeat protein